MSVAYVSLLGRSFWHEFRQKPCLLAAICGIDSRKLYRFVKASSGRNQASWPHFVAGTQEILTASYRRELKFEKADALCYIMLLCWSVLVNM